MEQNHVIQTTLRLNIPKLSWNKKPAGFWLSSNMHMYYASDNHITDGLSHLWLLMYSLFGRPISFPSYLPIMFYVVHTCVLIINTNTHKVLSDSHKYFTFVSHIFFIHFHDLLDSLHLAFIFALLSWRFYWNP